MYQCIIFFIVNNRDEYFILLRHSYHYNIIYNIHIIIIDILCLCIINKKFGIIFLIVIIFIFSLIVTLEINSKYQK